MIAAMSLYVAFSLILTREIIGRERYMVLLAYHTQTLCMLIVLAIVLWLRPRASGNG